MYNMSLICTDTPHQRPDYFVQEGDLGLDDGTPSLTENECVSLDHTTCTRN